MRWASCFSGIGAPELAWADLWGPPAWVAETDKFCCAVLAHHWPATPNLGDVAAADFAEKARGHGPVDLLVAGPPCQSFSVAGKRLGLDDPRGNLALVYLGVARELRPRWLVFENVPGLLSNWSGATADEIQPGQSGEFIESSDFAAFLGTLREGGYLGCWRSLDAQFAGLAQRRERVFFVGHLGDWRAAAAVLFESESLSGHPPPRREAGQRVAPCVERGTNQTGGPRPPGTTVDTVETLQVVSAADVADPITASYGKHGGRSAGKDSRMRNAVLASGGNRQSGPIDVATAVNAHGGPPGRQDFESETFVVPALTGSGRGVRCAGESRGQDSVIAHALTAEGADASEDGTGRGPPLVPVPIHSDAARSESSALTPSPDAEGRVRLRDPGLGIGRPGDPAFTLAAAGGHAVAFSCKDAGLDAGEVAPTLRAMPHDRSHANAGGQMAVAFHTSGYGGQVDDVAQPLQASDARLSNQVAGVIEPTMAVRRLTPRECERLQGFPDDHTRIPWRGRPAEDCPDGPRYRAIGNAMARPVIGWIGQRIDDFEAQAGMVARVSAEVSE